MHLFKVFINSFLNTFLFLFCKIIPTRKNHHSIIRTTYTYNCDRFIRFFRIRFSILLLVFNIYEENFWKIIRKNPLFYIIRLRIKNFILSVSVQFFIEWVDSVFINSLSIPVMNILYPEICFVFRTCEPDKLFFIWDFNDFNVCFTICPPVGHL